MSYSFYVIQANDPDNLELLESMHQLRFEVFCKELNWSKGLQVSDSMEFDEYDCENAYYIVRVNESNRVDATCRLISTTSPYMIDEHYAQFIDEQTPPHNRCIWEISRFCASNEARISTKGKISGQLIAAAIEFGLENGVKNYIALATDTVLPIIRRYSGWDPTPLGKRLKTPDDHSVCVLYTVSQEMLAHIRRKNDIRTPLLHISQRVANSLRQAA